jgi:hypothetical protein
MQSATEYHDGRSTRWDLKGQLNNLLALLLLPVLTSVPERAEWVVRMGYREKQEAVGQKTRLADLALLCANCHRMIHARRPWLTLDELRGLLR